MRRPSFSVRRARRGINPTLIFFLVGVALLVVGAALPGLTSLVLIGLFIVLTYAIAAIVWIMFSTS